ncbi:candidate type III effector Hop protein [Oceanobacillus picturae]|uniref:Candidate type III effector Hop protein n=1 Tax=Oceanobacillus picturae TaxID=171693 RepID=A0A0U9HBM6_9BACI|nr:four-carbon acid sugar kinase family protein [Oceanobacillus picturae]GAQ18689.1 candidate type III effector Hop protein [Oceanobacillus picturae]
MQNRRLLAFYGDDFTGSTDAMEALDSFGLRTILFLEPPTEELLERFSDAQCIGVAGTARAKNNEEMEKELTPVYKKFKEINPYFVHYKVCSTFDSAPEVGSIGYAADLARRYFESGSYPLLVAAPALGRYTVFGNHFANFHGSIYRLDKHPVMSKHPVTPMDEANLAVHLQKQTKQSIGTINMVDMERDPAEFTDGAEDIVLYDAAEEKEMSWFADKVWQDRSETTSQFLIGSSGIEYALGNKWKRDNIVEGKAKERQPRDIDQMLVVSGSVSEVTKRQLEHAEESGFHMEQLPYELFTEENVPESYLNRIIELLDSKKKVILYTAKGTEDKAIKATRDHLTQAGISDIGIHIGQQLGRWTKYIMERAPLKRVVISGGDTSGFVTSQLGIYGLEVLQGIAPGAPLCRAYSEDERFDDLEIALKSGQLGGEGFFENVFLAKKTY